MAGYSIRARYSLLLRDLPKAYLWQHQPDLKQPISSCCHHAATLALHGITGGVLQAEVLPDGSRAHDVAVWLAETQLAAAEAAAAAAAAPSAGHTSLEQQQEQQEAVSRAEAALEAALAAAVMPPSRPQPEQPETAELSSRTDSAGSFTQDWHDDFEASEGEGSDGLAPAPPSSAAPGLPDNFSRVGLARGSGELAAEFPDFPGPSQAVVCELAAGEACGCWSTISQLGVGRPCASSCANGIPSWSHQLAWRPVLQTCSHVGCHAGQMLYLPAGWFHEVTSFSSKESSTHLAINYWFHPPDNLQAGEAGFTKPYRSGYWASVYTDA